HDLSVTKYDLNDGLTDDIFTSRFYRLRNGQILLGASKSFLSFDPAAFTASAPPPGVRITGLQVFEKEIMIRDVSFRFPDSDQAVINHLSFTIKKGEKIGFVGTSGSGKTTLMNILLRFYIENTGDVLVDGVKLTRDNMSGWRKKIGYVKQDIFLIDGTVKENIAFGEDEVDEVRLMKAIKQASLDKFVQSLPEGVNTLIGEHGSRLSGGQKQRIGIARSLYRNAEILIFDEATSALDNATEQEVTESIDSLSETNKTIFIIAHRITTLKNCDKIYELKNGEISGMHKYHELMEKVL
ncbi:MAG: ATP-binding cassette domain-containing protein, partial [Bacteroidota bacterium]